MELALFLLFNAWIASTSEVDTTAYVDCVDTKSDCEPDNWNRCILEDSYYEACCMTCHTVSVLLPEAMSCYKQGSSDPMTPLECAQAAHANGDQYRELESRYSDSNPLGCFVGQDGKYFYWNHGLSTDYEPEFYGVSRVCLKSERPVSTADLRVYTPNTADGIGRVPMTVPKMEDDQWAWIEDEKTC